jgi:hypothetical protein
MYEPSGKTTTGRFKEDEYEGDKEEVDGDDCDCDCDLVEDAELE